MCISLPGRVTTLNGALAEVATADRTTWCNALAVPEVRIGDWVLTHANLIVAIISAEEADTMLQAATELQELLDAQDRADQERMVSPVRTLRTTRTTTRTRRSISAHRE
jgi:hydrogenase assembly chaperone HypC/HupF